jgi:molecular chaperone GrpE
VADVEEPDTETTGVAPDPGAHADEPDTETVGAAPEPGDDDDLPTAEHIAEELDELGRIQRERDEYLDTLRRVQADFENYRKRMLREQTALVERATQGLVDQLLPVLDLFERALESIDADKGDELAKVAKGVELVFTELYAALEKAGLSRIEALGKPFDPHEHEAVAQEDGDGEPIVCDVLRTGYRFKGRVLRPATVRVKR